MSEEQKKQHAPAQPAAPASDAEHMRRLEALLRESEERHALLVEGVKDSALFALDPEGRITWWGEGARRLAGYEEDEILGQHFSVLFTPEDRDRGLPERELETAAASGSAVDENWVVRKGGQRFWGSGFSAARRGEGGLTGYVKILRDLTERQQAHEALRESELRLRAALAAADMGTWLWQVPTDKQTLDENLHRLMGVTGGRTVHNLEDFLTFVHPDDRAGVREAFLRSVRERGRTSWWSSGWSGRTGRCAGSGTRARRSGTSGAGSST
jgi:PAS domain S-box-containing protein